MAEDVPFISEEDLEALLGTSVPNDLMLSIALDSACDIVRSYLGQRVNFVEDDEELVDGSGREGIRLRQRPVRVVTSVVEDDVALVENDDYILRRSILWRRSGDSWSAGEWSQGRANIAVTYDHGYDITGTIDLAVPADIRLAALMSSRRILKAVSNTAMPVGVKSGETIGDYSYELADLPEDVASAVAAAGALLPAEENLLDRYRFLGVASGSKV
jgi:hypothetical protein